MSFCGHPAKYCCNAHEAYQKMAVFLGQSEHAVSAFSSVHDLIFSLNLCELNQNAL